MTSLSLAPIAQFAEELADAARKISMPYFRTLLTVDHKTADQPVTIADRETEAKLRELIARKFPDHGIFGEEYGKTNIDSPYTWVVDPIDGTKSFITGMPLWSTLIAFLDHGKPVMGVVDIPGINERWVGAQGQPTTFNKKPVKTRDCKTLNDAIFYTTSPDLFKGKEVQVYEALSTTAKLRRFGGDSYMYGLMASGFVDIILESELQPYDYLSLVPVVEGAGGCLTDWEGKPLGMKSDGRVIAAGTPALHAAALDLIAKI